MDALWWKKNAFLNILRAWVPNVNYHVNTYLAMRALHVVRVIYERDVRLRVGDKIARTHYRPSSVILQPTIFSRLENPFQSPFFPLLDNNSDFTWKAPKRRRTSKIHNYRPLRENRPEFRITKPSPRAHTCTHTNTHEHTYTTRNVLYLFIYTYKIHVRRRHYVTGLDFHYTFVYDFFPFTTSNATATTTTTTATIT
jgi:hypothetical protein